MRSIPDYFPNYSARHFHACVASWLASYGLVCHVPLPLVQGEARTRWRRSRQAGPRVSRRETVTTALPWPRLLSSSPGLLIPVLLVGAFAYYYGMNKMEKSKLKAEIAELRERATERANLGASIALELC